LLDIKGNQFPHREGNTSQKQGCCFTNDSEGKSAAAAIIAGHRGIKGVIPSAQ